MPEAHLDELTCGNAVQIEIQPREMRILADAVLADLFLLGQNTARFQKLGSAFFHRADIVVIRVIGHRFGCSLLFQRKPERGRKIRERRDFLRVGVLLRKRKKAHGGGNIIRCGIRLEALAFAQHLADCGKLTERAADLHQLHSFNRHGISFSLEDFFAGKDQAVAKRCLTQPFRIT